MTCRCEQIERLQGAEGQDYERNHLRKVTVDPDSWRVLLKCQETGLLWKKHYPNSEAHGGGPPEYLRVSHDEAVKEFGAF